MRGLFEQSTGIDFLHIAVRHEFRSTLSKAGMIAVTRLRRLSDVLALMNKRSKRLIFTCYGRFWYFLQPQKVHRERLEENTNLLYKG